MAQVQAPFHERHEHGVKRGDGEQAVGEHRQHRVQAKRERMRVSGGDQPGEQSRQRGAQRREAEHQRLQPFELDEQALQPVNEHTEPQHARQRVAEAETEFGCGEQFLVKQPGMHQQRGEDRNALPQDCFLHGGRAPAGAPEVQRKDGISERNDAVE